MEFSSQAALTTSVPLVLTTTARPSSVQTAHAGASNAALPFTRHPGPGKKGVEIQLGPPQGAELWPTHAAWPALASRPELGQPEVWPPGAASPPAGPGRRFETNPG